MEVAIKKILSGLEVNFQKHILSYLLLFSSLFSHLVKTKRHFHNKKVSCISKKKWFLAPRWRTKGRLPTLPALTCLQIFQRQKSGRNIPETKTCLQIYQRQKSGRSLSTELPLSKCECKHTSYLEVVGRGGIFWMFWNLAAGEIKIRTPRCVIKNICQFLLSSEIICPSFSWIFLCLILENAKANLAMLSDDFRQILHALYYSVIKA